MNGLSNHDETYMEYTLTPTDDLILEVKGQGYSRTSRWRRLARRRWGIKVQIFLVSDPATPLLIYDNWICRCVLFVCGTRRGNTTTTGCTASISSAPITCSTTRGTGTVSAGAFPHVVFRFLGSPRPSISPSPSPRSSPKYDHFLCMNSHE